MMARNRLRAGLAALAVAAMVPAAVGLVGDSRPAAAATNPVTRVFNSMNDGQRVGQLFMASLNSSSPITAVDGLIVRNHVGSVILQGHWSSAAQVRRATSHLRSLTTKGNTANIEPYLAGDQEGGLVQPFKGPGFSTIPSALSQGTHTSSWLRSHAATWARQLRSAGININLAPVADTVPLSIRNTNAPIGALDRNFGFTTQGVSSHVTAFIYGMRDGGIATVVKHFPGLGRVTENTDFATKVVDSTTTSHDVDLKPFQAGIGARPRMVMISLAYYNRIDRYQQAAFSRKIITGMLRDDLHFTGVVISDSLGAASASTVSPGNRAIRFLQAGGDLMLQTDDSVIREMQLAILAKMHSNAGFKNLVYAAVKRVLAAKASNHLLP